jgi:transcriptional regulator with XRE-family HTH domain
LYHKTGILLFNIGNEAMPSLKVNGVYLKIYMAIVEIMTGKSIASVRGQVRAVSLEDGLNNGKDDINDPMMEKGFTLGKRVRYLRKKRGYSLRALAELSGLAINTLSMIENEKSSPSVSTLQQLARQLEVPITAFFETDIQEKEVVYVNHTHRPSLQVQANFLEYLGKELVGNVIQPFVVTLEAGAASGPSRIVHTGYEFVYCLSGKVLYTIDEQIYLLESGDSLTFASHLPHHWENLAIAASQIILVMVPFDQREKPAEKHFFTKPKS